MGDILLNALLAGCMIAIIAAPLGCFVVWRRLAYFSDTLSHSALLGIALGFLWQLDLQLAVTGTCFLLAILLLLLQRRQSLANDTLLGILAHSSLALGMVTISLLADVRIDLMAYLFGDLISVSELEILWIFAGGSILMVLLFWLWQPLLAATIHEELARVEGLPVERLRLALILMMALVIAVAMKIVGVLLISSLMIIPAATARRFSRTPEQMAILAVVLGLLSVTGGIYTAYLIDTPAGPSVVVCSAAIFLISQLLPAKSV